MNIRRTEPEVLKVFTEFIRDDYKVNTESTPQTWRPLRASLAGTCGRRLHYRTTGRADVIAAEEINETSALVNFAVGNFVHAAVQAAWLAHSPDTQLEVPFKLGPISGHADMIDQDTAFEIKTMGGTAHKSMFGLNSWQNKAEPPRPAYLLQGALAAYALEQKFVRLVLISKEAVSVSYANKNGLDDTERWGTEWICDDTDYIYELAQWEIKRMQQAAAIPNATLPHPTDGQLITITNPATGAYDYANGDPGRNQYWVCQYCPTQEICTSEWN